MAIIWNCPQCNKLWGGSASDYGDLCNDCSGRTAAKNAEKERWNKLTITEKLDELKKRLDDMGPVISEAWRHIPIG